MKDIKSLYYAARTSGNRTDIASYNEAVQQLFESGPLSVLPNVEYIISSDANLKKLDDMFAEYGLAIPVCNQIIEILESNVERCNTLGVDGSLFSEALNSYKQFRDNHKTCFDMYEYYLNDTQLSDYVKSYYSVNSGGIQGRRLAAGMISKFGEAAIPDAIITSDKYGRNTVSTLYEFLYPKTDALAKEWISECSHEIDNIDPKTYQLIEKNSLSALINKKDMTDNAFIRESVINGNEDACIPYSESDIKNIQDLIAFKEFKVACTEDTEYINTLQNEIYSLYESLEDIVDSDGESVFEFSENKSSESVEIKESRFDNADTKYTGNVPSYLARNHNLNWGETDVSKPVSDPDDESKSIDDYKRPSAIDKDDNQDNNEINKSDEEIEDKDKKDKSSTTGVNNYYYYTYTNSLNKNSNSFNKDNSNHSDDHSVHSSSDDHSSHRYNDDHSTGKRINSNDYGTKESDESDEDNMEESVGVGAAIAIGTAGIIAAGIIATIISSKIKSAKYKNNINQMLSDIAGKKVSSSQYKSSAEKLFASFIKDNHKAIMDNLYKPDSYNEDLEVNPKAELIVAGDDQSDYFRKHFGKSVNDRGLLIISSEIICGLIKKDKISEIEKDLSGKSELINVHISDEYVNEFPEDDNGLPWSYYINAGICDGGPEDAPEDNFTSYLDEQYKKIKDSGYVVVWICLAISDIDKFIKGDNVYTEAVGDADDMRPESDHPIRDLAQDVDRNLAKTQQAAKKKVQGVVQAGSAFMKPVKRTHQWVMKMCNDWKDAKETKIKEKFADPHARKGIFSAITWCIKTGSLAKAGLLFNPVFVFLSITKNIGKKDKMKRIRAEMIGEIKQEIEIIQEKIKDADAAGDKAAKYKLMRLKNELQKKLLRVGGSDVRSWKKIL